MFKIFLLLNFISTHQPLHNMFSIQLRENELFVCVRCEHYFSHFQHVRWREKKSPLGRMHNENTEICYKNKNSITGKKLLFHFYVLCGGSGNYRKKWPQEVRIFGLDNLWSESIQHTPTAFHPWRQQSALLFA